MQIILILRTFLRIIEKQEGLITLNLSDFLGKILFKDVTGCYPTIGQIWFIFRASLIVVKNLRSHS